MPEDAVEGSSNIYYFTDDNGDIHSREFRGEELIPDDKETEDAIKRNSSYVGSSCAFLRIRRCCCRHSRGIVHLFSDRQMPLSSQTIDIAHSIVNGDGRVRWEGAITAAQLDWIHTYGDCAVFFVRVNHSALTSEYEAGEPNTGSNTRTPRHYRHPLPEACMMYLRCIGKMAVTYRRDL
ncbi:MAG TPA: hypothetical protein VF393_06485 [archaeon]